MPILWLFAWIDGIPSIDIRLIHVFILSLPLELVAIILYIKALSISPLSLTVPFLSFTPAFLLLTSPIMVDELPSITGIIGVMFVVFGAYALNIKSIRMGLFYPFRMLSKEKGTLLMIFVAFIYSITSNFGKLGVIYSSPAFFAASYFSLLAIILFMITIKKGNYRNIFKKELFLIGLFSSMMITFHMMAIKLIYVSYMIAIKRSSLLFGIIFGYLFFHEKGLKEKLIGGAIMIAGMLLISFCR